MNKFTFITDKEEIERIKLFLNSNYNEELLESFDSFLVKIEGNYYQSIIGLNKDIPYILL